VKLMILNNQEWDYERGLPQFPSNCNFKDSETLSFKKYTDIANYLDAHLELKNKVMVVRNSNQVLGNKVIFNDFVYVEGRGYV